MASKIQELESEIAEMQSVVDDPSTPSDIKKPLEEAILAAKKQLVKATESAPSSSKASPLSLTKKKKAAPVLKKIAVKAKSYSPGSLKKRCAELAKKYNANKEATAERAEKRRDQGKPATLTPSETIRKAATSVQSKVVSMVKDDKKLDKQDSVSLSNGIIKTVQGILKGFKSAVNQKAFLSGLIADLQKMERKLPKAAMMGMKVDEGCGCMEFGGEINGFKLKHEVWSKAMGGNGISGTIRTCPENYYVATIDEKGDISFNEIESMTSGIDKKIVKKLWESGQIKPDKKKGKEYADGGSVDDQNNEMLVSKLKEIDHHSDELKHLINSETKIESWVVARATRAATDLSDVTHYIDGEQGITSMANGGSIDFLDNLHPLDLWVEGADGRLYRKFQFKKGDNFRDIADLGIKESIEEKPSGITEVILSVRSEDEADRISEVFMQNYKHGGTLAHDYGNKTPKDVWDSWDSEQRKHFIADHFGETLADSLNEKDLEMEGSEFYDAVKEHMDEGRYAKGGGVSKSEKEKLTNLAYQLQNVDESWIAKNHSDFVKMQNEYKEQFSKVYGHSNYADPNDYAKGGSTSRYNTGISWHQDRAKHNKSEDYEIPLNDRKENGGNIDEWNAEMGGVYKNGQRVGSYQYDRGSESFWIDIEGKDGQESFETKEELINYFKNNEFSKGGRFNTGRSWDQDHNRHNKSEDYEVAIKDRKEGGGAINYQKKWKVIYITLNGKKGTKEITLGRMSDKEDVKQAIRRMSDFNIREITSIQEIKEHGGEVDKLYRVVGKKKGQFNEENEYIKKNIKDVRVGDVILCSDGNERTVTSTDIKKDEFMGTTIFGDSWNLGHKPVLVRQYSKGGQVKFTDKVKAISKSLVGKKVPPKYKKEYGKTYDKKDAKLAGQRIAGSLIKNKSTKPASLTKSLKGKK
jgi:hypothetical protein